MITKYSLTDPKPTFKDGQEVIVDMGCLGFPPELRKGKIVGKAMEHLLDFWLIEFDSDFGPAYPFKVTSIQHTFIVKE